MRDIQILAAGLCVVSVHSLLIAQGSPNSSKTSASASVDTLPNDTTVSVGTLPNGMRYYIKVNKKPERRAELRLVVKAGSLMEDDSQRGLAHFVEHMAFRGTTHFKGTQIVEYLKSIGVGFGSDLNAETSFDRTVYILPIPMDTLAQVKRALQIMGDWAHGVAFHPEDVEEERKIILGERRMNLGASMRAIEQILPVLYKGSRYPDRLPIGTKESVERATKDQIVAFYEKWYRPDRMAIIAVGDFDKHEMESMIREQFSQISPPAIPLVSPVFPVPPQPGTLFSIVRDTELTNTEVMVAYKGAPYPRNTVAAERLELIRDMFDDILNQRLREILEIPNTPFVNAAVMHSLYNLDPTTVSIAGISLLVPDDAIVRGLDSVLVEVARVAQNGITSTELARAKENLIARIEHRYQNRNDQLSSQYLDSYIDNFISGTVYPSVETEAEVRGRLVPTLTLADINAEAAFWKESDNRVIAVMQPKRASLAAVDTMAMLRLFSTVASANLAPYTDRATLGALLEHKPTPGAIVSEKRYPKIGVIEWKLSNGAVVFLKPTTFKADEVLFAGSSLGGQSILPDSDFPTAGYLTQVVSSGRFGGFSGMELSKKLNGKVVQLEPSVTETSEGVQGSAAPKDLETLLQLAYLKMTDARYDSASVMAFAQQIRVMLSNMAANPQVVLFDTMNAILSGHSPRVSPLNSSLVDRVDPKLAFTLYKERFADASGFAFIFVGAFNPDSLKPMVQRYLASLPALHKNEHVQDRPQFHPPAGVVHKVVTAGVDQKTTTVLRFSGPYDITPQNNNDIFEMTHLLQNRLNNLLRERLGGTYSVGVNVGYLPKPISEYGVWIIFEADPPRREELVRGVFAEIDSLQRGQFGADEIQKVIAPDLRGRERERQTNQYWLQLLETYHQGMDLNDIVDDSRLSSTTVTQLKKAAQRYLNVRHYAEIALLPAVSTNPKTGAGAP